MITAALGLRTRTPQGRMHTFLNMTRANKHLFSDLYSGLKWVKENAEI